jgi:hypothetical protein
MEVSAGTGYGETGRVLNAEISGQEKTIRSERGKEDWMDVMG